LSNPQISWVKSATDSETENTTADKVVTAIRSGGKNEIRKQIEAIRAAAKAGDKQKTGELKKKLPAFLWSGTFRQRKNDALIKHSGLLCADLDSLNSDLPDVREKLKASSHLWTLFVSPSGDGLKAVFRVPADAAKHAGSFRAVEKQVRELTTKQIDQSCKDPARLCFISYDPELYHNPDAVELEPLPEPEKPKQWVSNGEVKLSERQHIATELFGPIDWQSETEGFAVNRCPFEQRHSTPNGARDLKVYVTPGEAPNGNCVHNSCKPMLAVLNRELQSRIGKAETPKAAQLPAPFIAETGAAVRSDEIGTYAFVDLEKIVSRKPEWVDEPFLARGELHILQGLGGSYKGTLTLTWAAEFSRRGEHVILLSAEDDMASKVKPLLEAAEANIPLIHPLIVKRGDNTAALVLPDNIRLLERAITENRATLVIIDPVVSYFSQYLNAHKDQDVKRALTPLGSLAQRTRAAIVAVHHVKKDMTGSPKLWGQGSTAFGTTARVVMTMHKLSEEETQLEVSKSNIGREGKGIIFRAKIVEVPPDIKVPRLTRAGDATASVEELANGQRKEEVSTTRQAAILMLDILEEEGEQKQTELFERVAQETALKVGTIRRKVYWDIIQEEGLVDNRKDGFKGGWLVSRSELERPPSLRSVAPKSDPRVTPASHATPGGHPSWDSPSMAKNDLSTLHSHPSYIYSPTMTSPMVSLETGHDSGTGMEAVAV
jgi:hypothetical protein